MDKFDDDNAADSPSSGTGPGSTAGSGPGSGVSAAISAAADAALAGWRAANIAAGQRCVAAHELMAECVRHPDCQADPDRPGFTVVDAEVMASSHLVRMFPISSYKAESLLSFAADLHFRYPAILAAMLSGRMDETTARALAEQMSHVDESVLDQIQQDVVEDYLSAIAAGERPGNKAVRKRADELISARDQDAVRARMADAGRERGASISKARDGMARLYALLHADEAAVLAEALNEKVAADRAAEQDAADRAAADYDNAAAAHSPDGADGQPGPGPGPGSSPGPGPGPDFGDDTYSLAQRRADALMSLICGDATRPDDKPSDSDDSDKPSQSATSSSGQADARGGVTLRPKVTVIAPGGSGGWADRARVEFARTGEAALQALLEMLAASDGASLQCIDPALGADDDPDGALQYRPSTALANRIRLRDGTCRHPGCTHPIENSDLDHVVPFNRADPAKGGLTVEANLAGLCRKHHRFKTFNDWNYKLEPDGTLIITTPEGKMMLTRPDGPLAAYRREQARAETQAWERQQRRNPDPDPGRATAASDANTGDHFEKSSWARREDRKQAQRQKQRAANAAERATALAAELAAAEHRTIPIEHGVRDVLRTHSQYTHGFRPIVVTATPSASDVPAHRHSRWLENNHPHHPDTPPSGLHAALQAARDIILGDETDPPPF